MMDARPLVEPVAVHRFPFRRLFVAALSAGIACTAVAADADAPGAMARFYSASSMDGLKLGITENADASDGAKRCVAALAPDALAGAYQAFLTKHYAAEDLVAFDAFIESPLGRKLQAYARARFLKSKTVEGVEDVVLTDEDQQALRAWGETEVGGKFVELYTNQRDTPEAPHVVEMKRLVEGCQHPE